MRINQEMSTHTKDGVVDWASFGGYLRERRERLGLSQAAFAVRLGCKQADVSRYEKGLRQPSVEVLIRYSRALQLSPQHLTGQLLKHIDEK
jgi:transcriptional regulator with XRE-family HTH domain